MLNSKSRSLDFTVLLLLLLWSLIGPSLFDDGWFIQTSQHSLGFRSFYNIYNIYDGRFPLGWLWFFLGSLWATVSDSLFWNRLPSVLYLFVSWKLILSSLNRLLNLSRRHAVLSSLFFLTVCFGFLVSTRPESFIVLCLTSVIYLLIGIDTENVEQRLGFTAIISGISLSTHLSGAVSVFPVVFWIFLNLKKFKPELNLFGLLKIVFRSIIAFVATFILNLFLFSNLRDFMLTRELWSSASESSNQSIFINFLDRFSEIFNENAADSYLRRSSFLLIALTFMFFNWGSPKMKPMNWIYWSLVFSLVFLLVIPSASPWQLGPLVVFSIFLVAGTLVLNENSLGFVSGSGLLIFLSIFNGIIWLSPNNDLFEFVDYMEFPSILQSLTQSIAFWLLLFSLFLIFGYFYLKVLHKQKMPVFFEIFSSTLLIFSFCLPIVVDVTEHFPNFRKDDNRSFFALSAVSGKDQPICSDDGTYSFPDLLNGVVVGYDGGELNPFSDGLIFNGNEVATTNLVPLDLGGFLGITSPMEFDYLLLFAKNAEGIPFSITLSNGERSIGEGFIGMNLKKRHGYTPHLFRLSDVTPADGSAGSILITTTEVGVNVSSPILIKEENVRYFSDNPNFNFQVSSELQPYFSCLSEEFFADGLSIKPHYMIGQLPMFPRSPANVFFDYEDYVLFPIDSVRNIAGYALVED
jgi:hypothetical protein